MALLRVSRRFLLLDDDLQNGMVVFEGLCFIHCGKVDCTAVLHRLRYTKKGGGGEGQRMVMRRRKEGEERSVIPLNT